MAKAAADSDFGLILAQLHRSPFMLFGGSLTGLWRGMEGHWTRSHADIWPSGGLFTATPEVRSDPRSTRKRPARPPRGSEAPKGPGYTGG